MPNSGKLIKSYVKQPTRYIYIYNSYVNEIDSAWSPTNLVDLMSNPSETSAGQKICLGVVRTGQWYRGKPPGRIRAGSSHEKWPFFLRDFHTSDTAIYLYVVYTLLDGIKSGTLHDRR